MQAVAASASIRTQAFTLIGAHLPTDHDRLRPVSEAGPSILADILIALERVFAIDLDPPEVWSFTADEIATLADLKVRSRARAALLPANDETGVVDLAAVRRQRQPRTPCAPVYLPERLPLWPLGLIDQLRPLLGRGLLLCGLAGGLAAMSVGAAEIAQRVLG